MDIDIVLFLVGLLIVLIIGYFVFDIKIKDMKNAKNNKRLDKIVDRFPDNKLICEDILKMINNQNVNVRENEDKDSKTSLYIALTDTIYIANIKDTYTRIQTIAHECLHSIQSKRMLMFNFIFSNIYILYFIGSIILTVLGIFKNIWIQLSILLVLSFVYYLIRSYLETDAMIKAKYLAKDYMTNHIKVNQISTEEEVEEVINEYDRINKLGIPAYNYILFFNCTVKIIIYLIVALILKLI